MAPSASASASADDNDNNNNNKILPTLTSHQAKEEAFQKFQSFLKFETVSNAAVQTGAYKECAAFLVQELSNLKVLDQVHLLEDAPDHSPVVVARWKGLDETLPVLLWNSHYDVVPANADDWTVPPFEGLRREKRIYGRGTQDMKCVCMQYLEAIRYVSTNLPDWKPQRTMYWTFVPDEEVGGGGMAAFLESSLYKETITKKHCGIALALDEGLASTTDVFSVFYGERLPWWIDVEATGPTGHGSRFIENTAVEQLVELMQKALQFRQGQKDALGMGKHENCTHAVVAKNNQKQQQQASPSSSSSSSKTLGDVTSLNITQLSSGVFAGGKLAANCVPPTAKCTMDIRISPHVPPSDIGNMLDQWCRECSKPPAGKVSWKYREDEGNSLQQHATTSIDATINPWYKVFATTLENLGMSLQPQVFPAATDSRFLRALGIRALGFSPMRNTEILLHENDEYILEETYLEGIGVYIRLLLALGDQTKEIDDDSTKNDNNNEEEPDTKKQKVG